MFKLKNNFFKNLLINKPAFFLPENIYVRYIFIISRFYSIFSKYKISNYTNQISNLYPIFTQHQITIKNQHIMFQSGFRISRFLKGFDNAGKRVWDRYRINDLIGSQIPRTILDVGANIGEFSYYANQKFGKSTRIISIEPDPVILNCLRFNLQKTKIQIEPTAVSRKIELLKFYLKPESADSSFHDPMNECVQIELVSSTLDLIIEKYNLVAPILVKMDCEGHEPEALQGLLRHKDKVSWISVDCSPERSGLSTLISVLKIINKSGFKKIKIYEDNIITASKFDLKNQTL